MIGRIFVIFALLTLARAVYIYPGHATSYVNRDSDYKLVPVYEGRLYGHGQDYGYGYGKGYGGHNYLDHYAYPKYKYIYGVDDPHTGDHKSQAEIRDGDVVKGYYTLAEPDGTQRIVHYTADDHNGFNAHVEKIGHAIHPAPVKIAYKPSYGYGHGYKNGYGPGYGGGYGY